MVSATTFKFFIQFTAYCAICTSSLSDPSILSRLSATNWYHKYLLYHMLYISSFFILTTLTHSV